MGMVRSALRLRPRVPPLAPNVDPLPQLDGHQREEIAALKRRTAVEAQASLVATEHLRRAVLDVPIEQMAAMIDLGINKRRT